MRRPKPLNIPEDINAELLFSYFPEGSCKVVFGGLHKRNTYQDITEINERYDGTLLLGIGRNSLYNALPEYMFHSFDRFGSISKLEEKKQFEEEYQKQEHEKDDAYKFFAPMDLLLLKQKIMVRNHLDEYVDKNKILIDLICDSLTKEQRNNRFITHTLDFIPLCKTVRGDKTFLTLMLRKIFMEEGLKIDVHRKIVTYVDDNPRYADGLDDVLETSYVGNVFDEETTIYDIHYWSEDDCDESFLQFIEEIKMFQIFIQDYFFSIEETLHFDIWKDDAPLRLSDDMIFNYLNFNTNL